MNKVTKLTKQQHEFLIKCVAGQELRRFYKTTWWKEKREEVLKLDHYECQICKAHGIRTEANTVHHVHHLEDYPDLGLSIYDEAGNRNLVSICPICHNKEHPEKAYRGKIVDKYTNDEKW